MRFVVKIIETTTTYTQLTCMHLNMKVSGFPHKTSGGFPAAVLTAWTIHPVPGITWLEPTRILKLTFNIQDVAEISGQNYMNIYMLLT